jgi:hypothetical protein
MMRTMVRRRSSIVILGCCLVVACVVASDTGGRLAETSSMQGTTVRTPIKAHLIDGGVIVFPDGALIDQTRVTGSGIRYDALRATLGATLERNVGIVLDSVLGFEVYERNVDPARTVVYSVAATGAAVLGTFLSVALLVAIFGSCPTIYGDSLGVETLQAESFSYSIAPLMAKRDVDRMTVAPDANGVIRLTVKNEALETHHLDQMEVIELRHAADEIAYPSPRGGAIAVADLAPEMKVVDGAGRDVRQLVQGADELVLATDPGFLDRAIEGGPVQDWLEITIPRPAGVDSAALLLRARSSLLTTSILYDHLMGSQGAYALDWMGEGLSRISTLAQLATWYGGNFGMRVEVRDGSEWRHVIRLMDFGPSHWRMVGVPLPLESSGDSIRVRLTFPADAFRIDQISVARRVRRVEQTILPIARAIDRTGASRPDLVAMLREADDREVETNPGDRFSIEFDAAPIRGTSRTFLFAGQGYYVEWLRPSWMKGRDPVPFSPSRTGMNDLLRSWRAGRDSLEAVFFNRRVPVL